MRDVYQTAFYRVIKETQEHNGVCLPEEIEAYIVMLLASYVDHNDFLPKRSFAESYLTIKSSRNAKELADTCLFVTGVFPEFGNTEYYVEIGKSSYGQMSTGLNNELFDSLSTHFVFVKDFIGLATTKPTTPTSYLFS